MNVTFSHRRCDAQRLQVFGQIRGVNPGVFNLHAPHPLRRADKRANAQHQRGKQRQPMANPRHQPSRALPIAHREAPAPVFRHHPQRRHIILAGKGTEMFAADAHVRQQQPHFPRAAQKTRQIDPIHRDGDKPRPPAHVPPPSTLMASIRPVTIASDDE